jgi:hypothetical protein
MDDELIQELELLATSVVQEADVIPVSLLRQAHSLLSKLASLALPTLPTSLSSALLTRRTTRAATSTILDTNQLTQDQVLQILIFFTTPLHASTTSTAALISPFFPSFLPELIALSSYLAFCPSTPSSQSEDIFLSIMEMPIGNVLDALLFLMGSSPDAWHKRIAGVWLGKTLRRSQGLKVFSSL